MISGSADEVSYYRVGYQPAIPGQGDVGIPDRQASEADQPLQLDGLSPGGPPNKGPGPSSNSSESYLAKLAKKDKSADR